MRLRIALALGAVYLIWGSTYLGIAVGIRTLPPFTLLAIRFLIAGALLYAWAARRGGVRPTLRHWGAAVVLAGGLLLIGTGGVAWAETRTDSGVVALVVAVMPLWLALLDRQRLSWRAIVGLALGFGGVALLVAPGAGAFSWPALVVVFTSLGWAAASLYGRSAPQPAPLLFAAMQMLAGGALLVVAGALHGELSHLQRPTLSSAEALLYLIVVGSLVGFTAYTWLLRNARMSLIGTYAFVNPVVAVLLGWAFNHEVLSARTVVAGAVIVAGVALIVLAPAYPERRRSARAAVPVRAQ